MKKTILNLGAILLAFVIGVSINNACAGSIDNMNDSELRKLVAELQQEVNDLKDRVAELERKNRNSSSNDSRNNDTGGEFVVNGMHFNRDGYCAEPLASYNYGGGYQVVDGVKTEGGASEVETKYSYDSYGRISSYGSESQINTTLTTYTYSDKTVTIQTETKYKDGRSGLTESGSTLIYRYK